MADLKLQATKREILGKKTRFLRRQGITPVHLFGHNLKSLALQCHTAELQSLISQVGMTRLFNLTIEKQKEPRNVFIREIQRDAITGQLLHIDLYQVLKTQRIKMDVPIVLVGEAPATKKKGQVLTQTLTELNIECLPDKLPPQIEIDVSILAEVDQAIFIKNIKLDSDITVFNDPEQIVVKVSEIREEEKVVEKVAEVLAEEVAAAPAEAEAETPAKEGPKAARKEPKK